jgi:SAM-dependent methyltransferase
MDLTTVLRELNSYASVLDVGTGHGKVLKSLKKPARIVGVDGCAHAVKVARTKVPRAEFVRMDVRDMLGRFGPDSFEAVVGFDIVEHLEREDAVRLLADCERIATKVVWWFVPIGNHPQAFDSRNEGNEELQRHRSTWRPQELADLGYRVWHYPDWYAKRPNVVVKHGKDPDAAFCRKTIDRDEQPGVVQIWRHKHA